MRHWDAYPKMTMPKKFYIDDSMFLLPPKDSSHIKIERGPNIGEPPKNTPLPDAISAEVTIKVGDEITTDHIIPAGAKMKYRSNVPKYSDSDRGIQSGWLRRSMS